jgi:4-hydroxybenzoate polyprenyltransferase
MPLTERLHQYYVLARMDRPIGTFLLLWPTLWALWIAGQGRPDPLVVLVFVAGVFLMRSAGCVINDYADRHFDPHVERTRERPLAAGRVSTREALILFAALCLVAFALVLLMNRLTILLSLVGVGLAITYPFLKRYTHLPQFYLGAAFGWGIPMAFAAQTGHVPLAAWLLLAANIVWAVAYDTMYAMVDRNDDVLIGVKSTAILFGRYDRLMVGIMQVLTLALLLWVGVLAGRGVYFFGLWGLAILFAVYEQFLIRQRERSRCFQAFLHNTWFGAAIFAGLVLDYLARP